MRPETRTPRCKYCREDAFALLQGWRHGPPERTAHNAHEDIDMRPDVVIPVCLVHRSTGVLRLVSMGFHNPTEAEVGTIIPGQGPEGAT